VRYRLESSHPRWVSIPALTGCGSMSRCRKPLVCKDLHQGFA
jgi:hypothetical protein